MLFLVPEAMHALWYIVYNFHVQVCNFWKQEYVMVYHFYNSVILVTITLFGIAGGKGGAMGL